MASGGKFGAGALSALVPAGGRELGFGNDILSAALLGGTASVVGGGKFANGAVTAAFAYSFSEAAHSAKNSAETESRIELEMRIGFKGEEWRITSSGTGEFVALTPSDLANASYYPGIGDVTAINGRTVVVTSPTGGFSISNVNPGQWETRFFSSVGEGQAHYRLTVYQPGQAAVSHAWSGGNPPSN